MATVNQLQNNLIDEDAEDASASVKTIETLEWDWKSWPKNVRIAASVLAILTGLVGSIIWFIEATTTEFTQKLDSQNGVKTQAQNKLRDSGKERDDIVKYLPLLRELEAKNIFGDEKRLEWVEQLRAIEKRWPGVSIKYDISPQKILPKAGVQGLAPQPPSGSKLPNGEPTKNFSVFSTDMKLTLSLLHEGDALAILEELKSANLGLFTLKQCSFRRPSNGDISNASEDSATALDVDCTLNWVSMNAYTP